MIVWNRIIYCVPGAQWRDSSRIFSKSNDRNFLGFLRRRPIVPRLYMGLIALNIDILELLWELTYIREFTSE